MSFRSNIKNIFNIMMSAILYGISLIYYLYVCPLVGPINPAGHTELYQYTIGAIVGLFWLTVSLIGIGVLLVAVLLIFWTISSIFDAMFNELFPKRDLTEEQMRDIKLEDALEKNPIQKFLNKIKRLR